MDINLDHFNILVEDWERTVNFYYSLFGFVEGKNVIDGRKNYLYTADHKNALIHLTSIQSKEESNKNPDKPHQIQATPVSQNQNTGALDHIALNVSKGNFDLLLEKLDFFKIKYRISQGKARQIWFFDPNGVKLEVFDGG